MTHHSFSKGRPKGHQFQTISTADITPAARFDFWTNDIVRNLKVDSPGAQQRKDFQATVTSLATATGEMHYAQSDGFSAHINAQTIRAAPFDELALILVLDGQAQCMYDGGEATAFTGGQFFLLDGQRPTSLHFSRLAFIQVDLARASMESMFPGSVPSPMAINAALARSRLTSLLCDHLRLFPTTAPKLSPFEQLALLETSESFALATIAGACLALSESSTQGLFVAAQRYIKRHLTNPDLTPGMVAAAIGCSRSTLYRLFADKQLTVQGYIRELRLQQFMRLLQKKHGAPSIQMAAMRCGLHDWSNVSRMFRKRFGMTPHEARLASN